MTSWEVAVVQADITAHMTLYTQAPIAKKTRVRGVLPGPAGAETVHIAVGGRRTFAGEFRAVYEMPLFRQDETLLSWQAVAFVRRELGEARPVDRAHTLLTTLSCPHPSFEERESAESLLVGFLYLRGGRMRLYVRRQDTPGSSPATYASRRRVRR
ncbi:hypothetical protein [Streptomyces acidiscabies]|uniref:hypothetical protein n=1 Tax=Streptomyces acidiscabies TaxID=42234 RepID=UPI002FEF494A